MAPFLQVGNADLSSYLRVNAGDGLQPGGQGQFLEPGFADNPFGEGQTLLSVTAKNREFVAPLFANTTSKDLLHDLVRDLNRELSKPGNTVQWRDDGATDTTYFTLAFGRLEEDYNYRRAVAQYLGVTVHMWLAPYGTTGTARLVGFSFGSVPIIMTSIGSALDGDAAAVGKYSLQVGAEVQGERLLVVAPLPHPSYLTDIPAASLSLIQGASLIGGSGCAGSQAIRMTDGGETRFRLPIPSVHAGANRVLIVARPMTEPGMAFTTFGPEGRAAGPTQVASGGGKGWLTYDGGVLRIPSTYPGPTAYDVAIKTGLPSLTVFGTLGLIDTAYRYGSSADPARIDVTRVLIIPDEQACYVRDGLRPLSGFFGGPAYANPTSAMIGDGLVDLYGNTFATIMAPSQAFGGSAAAYDYRVAYGGPPLWALTSADPRIGGVRVTHEAVRDIVVRGNTQFYGASQPNGFASTFATIRADDPLGSQWIEARLMKSSSARWMDVGIQAAATRYLIGSMGLRASQTTGDWTYWHMSLESRGPVVTANVRGHHPSDAVINAAGSQLSVASLGGSQGMFLGVKQAAFQSMEDQEFYRLESYALTATGPQPYDTYTLDSDGVRRIASGGDVTAILTPARGVVPKLSSPSTPAVAMAVLPIGQPGPVTQAAVTAVSVTERFRYAR